ncbi:hypothetical protein [uncultured Chryseobacterium sp.]|uniref:hypothetical protein n=1 Tax=uncultured Chryseobacterium sp. TaxID=259322 RepID=UPI0025F5BCC6|nr:hypothetical protein [uncultured Chryseobacterium sp.]
MKKIFYVPGLISALIVPVLFWYYIHPYIDETKYNVVDIGLPAKVKQEKNDFINSFEPLRNWNYKKIKVYPSTARENSVLYVSEIKAMQKRNEKETGIEFILNENNTYGDFVSLLNDMAIAKQETYALDLEKTGHFFAVTNYIDPYAQANFFGGDTVIIPIDHGSLSYGEYSPTLYETSKQILLNLPKPAYYIVFGFLLFLNISMFSIKENLQMRRNLVYKNV